MGALRADTSHLHMPGDDLTPLRHLLRGFELIEFLAVAISYERALTTWKVIMAPHIPVEAQFLRLERDGGDKPSVHQEPEGTVDGVEGDAR